MNVISMDFMMRSFMTSLPPPAQHFHRSRQSREWNEKTHQIRFPQPLASTKQLITRGPAHDKILRKIDAANTIETTNKRLSRLLVQPRNHWAHEKGTEASLVQGARDQVGHGCGGDVALLAEAIHVDFVAEEVRDGGDVGGEAGETEVDGGAVGEDLGEVVGNGEGLESES